MKQTLVVLLAYFVCLALSSYEGYKVVRVTDRNIEGVLALSEEHNLDVWRTNRNEGWIDVMIPESHYPLFANFSHSIRVKDVQQLIDSNEAERQQSRAENVGFFADFPTYDQVYTWVRDQAKAFSKVATVVTVGESFLGEDIFALHLSQEAGKEAIVLQCTIHAREWITTTTCCLIIEQLLKNQTMLAANDWIIIPIVNPDGYKYTHTISRLWRKNRQPNTRCVGIDLNRNYLYKWGTGGSSADPCSDTYKGEAPFTGKEVAQISKYISKLAEENRLKAFVDIHAYGGMLMSVWGYTTTLPSDYSRLNSVMKTMVSAIQKVNGHLYDYGSIANVIYVASGGSTDWIAGTLRVPQAYAIEASGDNFIVDPKQIVPVGTEVWAGIERMALVL